MRRLARITIRTNMISLNFKQDINCKKLLKPMSLVRLVVSLVRVEWLKRFTLLVKLVTLEPFYKHRLQGTWEASNLRLRQAKDLKASSLRL